MSRSQKATLHASRAAASSASVVALLIQSNDMPLQLRSTSGHRASGGSRMTSETVKALMMIFLFTSLSIAICVSESSATKRLRVLSLQALRRAQRR